jgi:hypothetical protein
MSAPKKSHSCWYRYSQWPGSNGLSDISPATLFMWLSEEDRSMKICPIDCPCRVWFTLHRNLTAIEWLQIEQNHFPEPTRVQQTTAAQGDVHWLDWHEERP